MMLSCRADVGGKCSLSAENDFRPMDSATMCGHLLNLPSLRGRSWTKAAAQAVLEEYAATQSRSAAPSMEARTSAKPPLSRHQ